MSRHDILTVIKELATSKGEYGRLLRDLQAGGEYAEAFFAEAEAQHFKEPLDFVLWYECG